MQIKNYTVYFYSTKGGIMNQVPNTSRMTRNDANTLARDLRLNHSGKQQVAVYRYNELVSCFGMSDNMKPVITI